MNFILESGIKISEKKYMKNKLSVNLNNKFIQKFNIKKNNEGSMINNIFN